MCPVCTRSPPVLAPCLLGGRMLGPGWLVHFRRIGLDHSIGVPSDAVTERDNRRWRLTAGLASRPSFLVAMESGAACRRTSAPPEPAVLAGRESPRGADPGQGAFLTWAVSGAARPGPIVGTRGVHFRPGQPVRGLARVQWDTARSGLDGRRNPGRTVRRQTGLRADGGFAQGRRAQDWAGSLEDREDPGGAGSLCRSAACRTPRYQHGFSTGCPSGMPVSARPAHAISQARRGRAPADGRRRPGNWRMPSPLCRSRAGHCR